MPDWWIMGEVARRLGFGAAFDFDSAADIFREHAALSAFENDGGRDFDIGALPPLSDGDYEAMAPVQWPVRQGSEPQARFFADGGFFRQRPQGALHRPGSAGAADRDHGRRGRCGSTPGASATSGTP